MPERKIECSYGSIVITDDHGLYLYAERDRERVGVSLRPEDARKTPGRSPRSSRRLLKPTTSTEARPTGEEWEMADEQEIQIATKAVAEEYGSYLCRWVTPISRECRSVLGGACQCRLIGIAVLAALEEQGYRLCPPNSVLFPQTRKEAEAMNLISAKALTPESSLK